MFSFISKIKKSLKNNNSKSSDSKKIRINIHITTTNNALSKQQYAKYLSRFPIINTSVKYDSSTKTYYFIRTQKYLDDKSLTPSIIKKEIQNYIIKNGSHLALTRDFKRTNIKVSSSVMSGGGRSKTRKTRKNLNK
jgi:hypothetical protein